MSSARSLIVTADEFGRSPGVNLGIAEAHREGIVTSASALVCYPAADHAARIAGQHPGLSVGLRLDLCEWEYARGEWRERYARVPVGDPDAVAREAGLQLARFREVFGRNPTHLDSHQNVHRNEPARSVLLAMARDLGVGLRHFTEGVFVCSEFHGQTSRGYPYREGITVERLVAILAALPPGVTELVCLPGREPGAVGTYGPEREVERAVLCDPRVRAALIVHDITLRSFAGLPADVSAQAAGCEPSFRARGRAAWERGDYRQARFWFERACAVDESQPFAWLWLSRAELRTGDTEAARVSALNCLALGADLPAAHLHLADILMRENRHPEAAGALERALALSDAAGDVARGVARRLLRLGDVAGARRMAEAVVRAHPDEETGTIAHAVALWRSGDRDAAVRALARSARGNGAASARVRGAFYLEVGEPRTAWEAVRTRNGAGLAPALLLGIAHGLRGQGDLPLAWEAYDRILALYPGERAARRWRDAVIGEVQVLSGSWSSSAPRVGRYRPVPGRILHVVGKSLPHAQTGYSVRTRYLVRAQREQGFDPHVVTQLGFPWDLGVVEASTCDEVDGVTHHRLPGPAGPSARLDDRLSLNIRELAALVRRLRPALLHAASDYRNALLATAVGRACGIPVVYEVRGFWEETWRSKRRPDAVGSVGYRWRRERELACMLGVDRVVTLAEVMARELVDRGVPRERIVIVPNAVDVEVFHPVERDGTLARHLGIREDETVIGCISSLAPYEGLAGLIEAVARVLAGGLRVRALLVGDGEERDRLRARARDLGIADRVILTGRVPHADILRYYGLIDVFVVPRTADRVSRLVTPLKPFEAMATGRALVVSDVEALREMVQPGVTGLLVPPDDPQALSAVVEELVQSPDRRTALGREAHAWVSAHRTWTQNGERCAELYQSLGVEAPAEPGASARRGPHLLEQPPSRRNGAGSSRFDPASPRAPARPASPPEPRRISHV